MYALEQISGFYGLQDFSFAPSFIDMGETGPFQLKDAGNQSLKLQMLELHALEWNLKDI